MRKVLKAASLAQRRGSKSISPDDVIFVIRHDTAKLKRLREFLNWKDVRKNVKQSEDTNAGGGIPFEIDEEDVEDVVAAETASISAAPVKSARSGSIVALNSSNNVKGNTKKRSHYYWDCLASLIADATNGSVLDFDPIDVDEEQEDAKEESLRRLREADRITRTMSKAEYMDFTECRQASFTYKKAKKFRDWIAIPATVTEYKLSDEVLEVLGFLASEIVRQITEGALKFTGKIVSEITDKGREGKVEAVPQVSLFMAPQQKSPIQPEQITRYLESKATNTHKFSENYNSWGRSKIKLY